MPVPGDNETQKCCIEMKRDTNSPWDLHISLVKDLEMMSLLRNH